MIQGTANSNNSSVGNTAPSWVPLISSSLLLVAAILGEWPYGFYILLRIVVCSTSVYLAWWSARLKKPTLLWVLSGIGILFNPLVPVHISRDVWRVLDALAFVILVIAALTLAREPST